MMQLQTITLLIVGTLLLAMGALAYFLGNTIVRPLKRLSNDAGKVAAGDLNVDIPVRGNNEVSYLTQVFNHMVSNLRRGQAEISQAHEALIEKNRELHQLSITDGLTSLLNPALPDSFFRIDRRHRSFQDNQRHLWALGW
jgi:nitrogen fixation/metabolism regulation signal transduction histidine kinase